MRAAAGLLLGLLAGRAAAGSLADRLERKLQAIPYVDTHCHLPDPGDLSRDLAAGGRYDVVRVLGASTYVGEFLPGSSWSEVRETLAVNAHHAYYRPILRAFRDLYGLGSREELHDGNVERLSARMDAAHRDPGWFDEVLGRRANVAHLVWLSWDPRPQSAMPRPYFHPMWNVDRDLVFVAGKPKEGEAWALDRVQRAFGVELEAIEDFEALIDAEIGRFFEAGGVGLKSTAAYFRPLDFDHAVTRASAAPVFARLLAHEAPSPEDRTRLEDYLMTRVLEAAAKRKKPVQFHTGNQQNWGRVAESNPLGLNELLYSGRLWDATFVLLHGGYPYVEEAITLTRYFGNVRLDLAWMALFSPAAAKRALADALDLLDGRKVMFGTDAANLEELYGTVAFTRRILAEVLAEKIESGFLTEPVALAAARRVLYANAAELYGFERRP